MVDIQAEIGQVEDLSWNIYIQWYGHTTILNAFASASEALGELMSLYNNQTLQVNVIPYIQ